MSLQVQPIDPVPAETGRVAHAALPKGNPYLQLRDQLGPFYTDARFAHLFPRRGRPAEAPWRLALVSVLQLAENLTDRQAADAVRSRIDWKYLLGLELTDDGFDFSVLSEFRSRLLAGSAEHLLLDALLERCREAKLLRARGRQRTDATHVLGAIRVLNRLECVGEAVRHALQTLAVAAPTWVRSHIPPDWVDRYAPRMESSRHPRSQAERQALALTIGADGFALLEALWDPATPAGFRELEAVDVLRRIWLQQFYREGGQVHWRAEGNLPPASIRIHSPYDPQAHYGTKRTRLRQLSEHGGRVCPEPGMLRRVTPLQKVRSAPWPVRTAGRLGPRNSRRIPAGAIGPSAARPADGASINERARPSTT